MPQTKYITKALFDAEIISKGEVILNGRFDYERIKVNLEKIIQDHPENTELVKVCKGELEKGFGFTGYSTDDFKFKLSARLPREPLEEKHTCALRVMDGNSEENLDSWIMIHNDDKDKTCSYCGSLHPDQVFELMEKYGNSVLDPGRAGKYYVNRPEIVNAGFGAIKFYTPHFSPEQYPGLFRETLIKNAQKANQTNQ